MASGGDNKAALSVRVITPDATLFDGTAEAVLSVNDEGDFTILPGHTNFISLIKERVIVQLADGISKTIPVELGILRSKDDTIEVFTGLAKLRSRQEPT